MSTIERHPVQKHNRGGSTECAKTVTMRAYEVYCHLYGEQERMVTGGCRGGFSTGELIAFLYARSFPKDEWRDRTEECFSGAVNL